MNEQSPQNAEAEKTILGAIMLDNASFYEAAEHLSAQDFYESRHRRIYAAMAILVDEHKSLDIVTISEQLNSSRELDTAGGSGYISSLIDGVPHQPSILEYVEIVRDKARRRQLIQTLNSALGQAHEVGETTSDCIAQVQSKLVDLTIRSRKHLAEPLSAIMPRVVAGIKESSTVDPKREAIGLRTGLAKLDRATKGYRPGEYIIISGSTGDGKTVFCHQCLLSNAFDGVPSMLFAGEMRKEANAQRMLAATGTFPYRQLKDPRGLDMYALAGLPDMAREIGKLPIFIDDHPGLHIKELRSRARAFVRREGVKLIAIDYVQLVKGDGETSVERLNDVSGGLRELSKEENIPVIALSQYSRMEGKVKRRPNLMDLKGSGQLEQDADIVIAVYRPQKDNGAWTDEDEIILLKHRGGETGLAAEVVLNRDRLWFDMREGN